MKKQLTDVVILVMLLGELVGWMHGANAPLMKQTVDRLFENEVKVKVFFYLIKHLILSS